MKKILTLILASAIVSMISSYAFAQNYGFLSNSAMSFFTKEDWTISRSAQSKALNQTRDGVKLAWINPHTGTHGIFLPTHTYHANGAVCRDLEIRHSANLMNEKSIYRFCKMKNQWKIV